MQRVHVANISKAPPAADRKLESRCKSLHAQNGGRVKPGRVLSGLGAIELGSGCMCARGPCMHSASEGQHMHSQSLWTTSTGDGLYSRVSDVSFINVLNAVAHGSAPLEICARIRSTSDTVCQPAGCESAVPRSLVVAPVASAAAAKLTTINVTGHIIVHNRATASTDAARRGRRTAARWACMHTRSKFREQSIVRGDVAVCPDHAPRDRAYSSSFRACMRKIVQRSMKVPNVREFRQPVKARARGASVAVELGATMADFVAFLVRPDTICRVVVWVSVGCAGVSVF